MAEFVLRDVQIGFRTIKATLAAGERRAFDAQWSTIQNIASGGDLVLFPGLSQSGVSFGKGIGYSLPYVPERGQAYEKGFALENPGALSVDCEIIVGVGQINDSRVNFVAGASALEVKVIEDKQRHSSRPLNVPNAPTVLTVVAAGSQASTGADDWTGEITICNAGAVPLIIRRTTGVTGGLRLMPDDSMTLRGAHSYYVANDSDFSGAFYYFQSKETVIV